LAASIGASKAAADLGIDHSLISAWKRSMAVEGDEAFRGHGVRTVEAAELVRLRRENAHLKMEREILKKATEFFMREQM
jgi:transposase